METNTINSNNTDRIYGIIGAVIGDIVGSRFEADMHKNKFARYNFKFFGANNTFTDDSILTIAVADALMNDIPFNEALWDWGNKYPYAGWGGSFRHWLKGSASTQNTSFGNGCGMRISPVGFYAKTLEQTLDLAKQVTVPTHNSEEAIAGAQAIAASIFLARGGKTKEEIRKYVEKTFKYELGLSTEQIQEKTRGLDSGNGARAGITIPFAINAFLSGNDYEDVVRTAITYGGDTDTIACMAGGIAAAFYGVPMDLVNQAVAYLDKDLLEVINAFDKTHLVSAQVTPSNIRQWGKNVIVVYGANVNQGERGEEGASEVVFSMFNKHPHEGFAIRTIGASFSTTKEDVNSLIAFVQENPDRLFVIRKVGLGDSGIGLEKIAPLFKPLLGQSNVYLPKEYLKMYEGKI